MRYVQGFVRDYVRKMALKSYSFLTLCPEVLKYSKATLPSAPRGQPKTPKDDVMEQPNATAITVSWLHMGWLDSKGLPVHHLLGASGACSEEVLLWVLPSLEPIVSTKCLEKEGSKLNQTLHGIHSQLVLRESFSNFHLFFDSPASKDSSWSRILDGIGRQNCWFMNTVQAHSERKTRQCEEWRCAKWSQFLLGEVCRTTCRQSPTEGAFSPPLPEAIPSEKPPVS